MKNTGPVVYVSAALLLRMRTAVSGHGTEEGTRGNAAGYLLFSAVSYLRKSASVPNLHMHKLVNALDDNNTALHHTLGCNPNSVLSAPLSDPGPGHSEFRLHRCVSFSCVWSGRRGLSETDPWGATGTTGLRR